jgi:hypothetical protein
MSTVTNPPFGDGGYGKYDAGYGYGGGSDITATFAGAEDSCTTGGAVYGGGLFGAIVAIGATPLLVLGVILAILGAIIFSSSKKAHVAGGFFLAIGGLLGFAAMSIMKKGAAAKA